MRDSECEDGGIRLAFPFCTSSKSQQTKRTRNSNANPPAIKLEGS
jgi:hypothetical protein